MSPAAEVLLLLGSAVEVDESWCEACQAAAAGKKIFEVNINLAEVLLLLL